MQAPEFWAKDGLLPKLLSPLGLAYHLAGVLRRARATPWQAPVPVICIGNLVAGGAGKTPVALSLLAILQAQGLNPAALTRGYGGGEAGPLQVRPGSHDAAAVGDEALLLAEAAPTWVARDRAAGAQAAAAAGANVIIMDDGFQNPSLKKDLSLLVVDGAYGFGNGHVIPAGPLRERPSGGLARADAVVLIGDGPGRSDLGAVGDTVPILKASLTATDDMLAGRRVFAFAGIGRPEKFFQTLRDLGAELAGVEAFADHQPYDSITLERLRLKAKAFDAALVTTAKDAVRLGPEAPRDITVLDVILAWDDKDALLRLLERLPFNTARTRG
ncbi:tetraacyldisaccharide 4'-kinase [Pelagibius litoralis]|uniref:Tetraacyldisaccharide 4'-kinase n=1 Tax=Pelagibius litoralis TaxID=374515 RepID=A0A967F1A3_9PROT|nr:tetraacyldisaccharide 4'-kinase [Pelagibius litoralis]NIA71194.1 tetraacyldisaccharide 4'-kinase [Pelagibius litoralis]